MVPTAWGLCANLAVALMRVGDNPNSLEVCHARCLFVASRMPISSIECIAVCALTEVPDVSVWEASQCALDHFPAGGSGEERSVPSW